MESVPGPAMPSAVRPFASWKSLTARSVPEPNCPSGAVERYPRLCKYCCSTSTSPPLLPLRSVESVPVDGVCPTLSAPDASVPESAATARPLSSLLCVPLPAMPSAVRPFALWKALSASVVSASKRPSMRPV